MVTSDDKVAFCCPNGNERRPIWKFSRIVRRNHSTPLSEMGVDIDGGKAGFVARVGATGGSIAPYCADLM